MDSVIKSEVLTKLESNKKKSFSRKRFRSEESLSSNNLGNEEQISSGVLVTEAIPVLLPTRLESITKTSIEKPTFTLSGALTKDVSAGLVTISGKKLKFVEPPEARIPDKKWRLHVFKGDKEMCEPLRLHRQSSFLIGKDKEIAEIYVEHPSCSKQHAVIQFRLVSKNKDDDMFSKKVSIIPYFIDLESTNGSYLNGKKLESSRYVELRPSDVLRFGESAREYVLLHEDISKTSLTQE